MEENAYRMLKSRMLEALVNIILKKIMTNLKIDIIIISLDIIISL